MLGKRGVLKIWRGYDGMDLGYKGEGKWYKKKVRQGVEYGRVVHGECTLGT